MFGEIERLREQPVADPRPAPTWRRCYRFGDGARADRGTRVRHPAVICVPGATERIRTGQVISIDGAAGTVAIEQHVPAEATITP